MLNNLSGWHALIILTVLLLMAAVVAGIVLLLVFLVRRSAPRVPSASGHGAHAADRLTALDELRARDLLSPEEYAAKRTAILGEL